MSVDSVLHESPMQTVNFSGFTIHVKRDDLLNEHFSGNKARKFAYLLDSNLTLSSGNDFQQIKKIVSYGSIQANSLYSLAALAKLKNWQLDFYVTRIPGWLKNSPDGESLTSPIGNYGGALNLGANVIEVADDEIARSGNNLDDYMAKKIQSLSVETLFIPEGGRSITAKYGVEQLAKEINTYCQQLSINHVTKRAFTKTITKATIMLPAGTGTTALFLQTWFKQQNLPHQVLTCACVGGDDYLRKQFQQLDSNTTHWPTILTPHKKYHFGKLYPEFYQLWQKLIDETKIEFDLLYDPLGWQELLSFLNKQSISQPTGQTGSENQKSVVIYIHQGGLVGNETMRPRYQRKYPDKSKNQ
jgi:1-aminocyclopropane-1-carboxylate deaminase